MDKKGISRAGIIGIIVVIVIVAAGAGYFLMSGPAEEEDTIKIGVIGPQKEVTGKQHIWGAEPAVEQINEQGGLLGKKLEIVTKDVGETPTQARTSMKRLIEQKGADVVLGGQRTERVREMQDVMAEQEVIFLGCGAADDSLVNRVGEDYDKYKYFFMISPYPSSKMGAAMTYGIIDIVTSEQLMAVLGGAPKIAIVAEQIDWVTQVVKAIKGAVAPIEGVEVVLTARPAQDQTDLTATLSNIEGSEANVIVQILSGPVGTPFGRQWGEKEIPAIPIGINVEAQSLDFWDETNGEGEYLIGSHDAGVENGTPIAGDLLNYFKEEHDEYPTYNGYGAYDAVFEWAEAVHRAGTLEEDNVIEEMEHDPDPMKYAHFKRFGKKIPQGCGSFSARKLPLTENHYQPNYPYQPGKTIESVEGPLRAIAGWTFGQWIDGEKVVVYPPKWVEAEITLPPWM